MNSSAAARATTDRSGTVIEAVWESGVSEVEYSSSAASEHPTSKTQNNTASRTNRRTRRTRCPRVLAFPVSGGFTDRGGPLKRVRRFEDWAPSAAVAHPCVGRAGTVLQVCGHYLPSTDSLAAKQPAKHVSDLTLVGGFSRSWRRFSFSWRMSHTCGEWMRGAGSLIVAFLREGLPTL